MSAALTVAGWILGAIAVFYTLCFLFIGAVWLYVNVAYRCSLTCKRLAARIRRN